MEKASVNGLEQMMIEKSKKLLLGTSDFTALSLKAV